MNASDQISLFYSYAHTDAKLRDKLDKHLGLLHRSGFIAQWYDRDISAGTEWASQIDQHLNTAHIILLLISADFLASAYTYSVEMKRALERHEAGEARVIPILLRPVFWEDAPFAHLQILPQNAKPVTAWSNQDLAFVDITHQIRKVVIELRGDNTSQEHVSPDVSPSLREFRHCQKKVSELKNIHNMLHEITMQLEGLEATVKTASWDNEQRPLTSEGTRLHTFDFKFIEISWRQVVLKMDDLGFFAAEEMNVLNDERFSIDSDVIRGPSWVKEQFVLRQYFEASLRNQDMEAVKRLSDELLRNCSSHLYRIDKRLLDAVKELDRASDFIMRDGR